MIVRVAQPSSYGWIKDRLGLCPSSEFKAIEAIRDDGTIAGMIGYDSWTPGSVVLSIVLDAPAALRQLVRAGFLMAFEVCKREAAICVVRADNRASLQLVEHLGFRKVGEIPNGAAAGVGLVIWQMQRADCRWLYGRERKAA